MRRTIPTWVERPGGLGRLVVSLPTHPHAVLELAAVDGAHADRVEWIWRTTAGRVVALAVGGRA